MVFSKVAASVLREKNVLDALSSRPIIATTFPLLVFNRRKRGRNSRREKLIFGVCFDKIRRNSSAEIPLGTRLRRMHGTKSEATVFYDGCYVYKRAVRDRTKCRHEK